MIIDTHALAPAEHDELSCVGEEQFVGPDEERYRRKLIHGTVYRAHQASVYILVPRPGCADYLEEPPAEHRIE